MINIQILEEVTGEVIGAAVVGWFVFMRAYLRKKITTPIDELREKIKQLEKRLIELEGQTIPRTWRK